MKPNKCDLCNGELREGKTEFVARVRDKVVVIKDVPAYICEECGEAYFTPEISRKIDRIMREFHEGRLLMRPIAAGEVKFKI
jgi:YgiT-type zinc finger domain-containing protein